MDTVIAYSLLFCALMSVFIYFGRKGPKPPRPKIILPSLKKKK